MGDVTRREILGLRRELEEAGVIPPERPEPELRTEAAMKQAMKSPLGRIGLAVMLLGGGSWAFDAPTAIGNLLVSRTVKAENRAESRAEAREMDQGAISKALRETPEWAVLTAKVDSVAKKVDGMDDKLDLLITADARRKGREDAERERHERTGR